jgi:uncharacterized protein
MKDFEWDKEKQEFNLAKHEIDFVDAVKIFEDPDRVELESARNGEKRYITIGIVNNIVMLVVYTWRSEKKRIISARKASKNERNTYHILRGER